MADFNTAWEQVTKKEEGGFSFVKGDRGGPTNLGVTHRNWRAYKGMDAYPFPQYLHDMTAEQFAALPADRQHVPIGQLSGPQAPMNRADMETAEAQECAMMQALTEADVLPFYRERYWAPIKGDSIAEQVVANGLFDEAVNAGVGEAVKLMQRVLGVLDDGMMGKETVAAVNGYQVAGDAAHTPGQALALAYAQRRIALYHQIADSNPNDRRFLAEWDARAMRVAGFQPTA